MMYDALYARQSVEKKDSISVESQLAYCRYETHGEDCREYTDRGFSGKDVNRPGFEEMMRDVRAGRVKRVIVYKLDRISRSILDFANMMEVFQQYDVEFISSTEKFDTSTPIGRAMLNICIVFAQLERETIQKRVTDAYYARCRRGFYMGGRIPYGFRLTDAVIDMIHTAMYEEVPEESAQIRLIFSMYADADNSLGDIVRVLQKRGIRHLRGATWNTARLSELLKNPVYVRADIEVYHFFQSQGVHIVNPVSDFTGINGCYLYKGASLGTAKRCSLSGKELVLAPHEGVIPSDIWLSCRRRCLEHRQSAKTCRSKNSWLAGKVKCGRCGYALTIKKAKTKWERYFVCSRAGAQGECSGTGTTIYADVLEEHMLCAIEKKLPYFQKRGAARTAEEEQKDAGRKIRLEEIMGEIDELLSRVPAAGSALMRYIDERISELDVEREHLREELEKGSLTGNGDGMGRTAEYGKLWKELGFKERQAVLDALVRVIRIADGKAEIYWKVWQGPDGALKQRCAEEC